MPFMEKQVTESSLWIAVDGNCGITFVLDDVVGGAWSEGMSFDAEHPEFESRVALVRDYSESTRIDRIETVKGFGARLSAPGYMDCTEWSVFATAQEAEDFLEEHYGDDEEEGDG